MQWVRSEKMRVQSQEAAFRAPIGSRLSSDVL